MGIFLLHRAHNIIEGKGCAILAKGMWPKLTKISIGIENCIEPTVGRAGKGTCFLNNFVNKLFAKRFIHSKRNDKNKYSKLKNKITISCNLLSFYFSKNKIEIKGTK